MMARILRSGFQQHAQQRMAHDGFVGRGWVDHLDIGQAVIALVSVRRQTRFHFRRCQPVADIFAQAQRHQHIAHIFLIFQRGVGPLWGHLVIHNRVRDGVVAVNTRDFLNQVGLAGH